MINHVLSKTINIIMSMGLWHSCYGDNKIKIRVVANSKCFVCEFVSKTRPDSYWIYLKLIHNPKETKRVELLPPAVSGACSTVLSFVIGSLLLLRKCYAQKLAASCLSKIISNAVVHLFYWRLHQESFRCRSAPTVSHVTLSMGEMDPPEMTPPTLQHYEWAAGFYGWYKRHY